MSDSTRMEETEKASSGRLTLRGDSCSVKWYNVTTLQLFRGSLEIDGPPPPKKPCGGLAEEVGTVLERLKDPPPPVPGRHFPIHLFLTQNDPDKVFDDAEFLKYVQDRDKANYRPLPSQSVLTTTTSTTPSTSVVRRKSSYSLLSQSSQSSISSLTKNGGIRLQLDEPMHQLHSHVNRRRRSAVIREEEAKKARLMMEEEEHDQEKVDDDDDEEEDEEEEDEDEEEEEDDDGEEGEEKDGEEEAEAVKIIRRMRIGRTKKCRGIHGVKRLGLNPLEFQMVS